MSHQLNDTTAEGYKIFLQSKDATILQDGGSTAFFFLNKVLMPPTPNLNMMIGVIDCEIPVSYYNINENNNTIIINTIEMTLEKQNYNAFNIQDELNSNFLTEGLDIVLSFNQQSNKFTFTANSGTVTINGGTLYSYLGFTDSQINQAVTVLTGDNCCNLGGTSNIYVSSNFTINNLNSDGQYSGVLCKVLTDAPSGNYIFYEPAEIQYHVVGNGAVNNIVISLRDDELNTIDFNGLTFSLTLSVQFHYKRELKDYNDYLLHTVEKKDNIYSDNLDNIKDETETKDN